MEARRTTTTGGTYEMIDVTFVQDTTAAAGSSGDTSTASPTSLASVMLGSSIEFEMLTLSESDEIERAAPKSTGSAPTNR